MKVAILIALVTVAWAGRAQYVDNEFLVGIKTGTNIQKLLRNTKIQLKRSFNFGVIHVNANDVDIEVLKKSPLVKYVERNGIAHTEQCSTANANGCWGLDRIDQVVALTYIDPTSSFAEYDSGLDTGAGVNVFVCDTGIEVSHPDFGGRANFSYNAVGVENPGQDNNGHGTHCAGTVGSNSFGVAKGVSIHAVKVLGDNGSGAWSWIIDGMEWVANTGHTSGAKSVISMSIGGSGITQSVLDAVKYCYDAGVTVSVSAGNSDIDACNYTPSAAPEAITVGASDVSDKSATFTNWGPCVDVFAPGVNVKSTWIDGGDNVISGTSMACPHVAGVAARYMSSVSPAPTPAQVAQFIINNANLDLIDWRDDNDHATSPNRLLHAECVI